MKQNVMKSGENKRIVIGKVSGVERSGNVATVKIVSGVWDKEARTENQNELAISFWNNERVKMADRVEAMKLVPETSIVAIEVYEKDGKLYGDKIGYSTHWTVPDPEGVKPDRNFFFGRISRLRSDEKAVHFSLSGIRNAEGWENPDLSIWKRDEDNTYDRAMKVLKDDVLVALVTGQWNPRAYVDKEGNERVSDNYSVFSFDVADWPRKSSETPESEET